MLLPSLIPPWLEPCTTSERGRVSSGERSRKTSEGKRPCLSFLANRTRLPRRDSASRFVILILPSLRANTVCLTASQHRTTPSFRKGEIPLVAPPASTGLHLGCHGLVPG